MLGTWQLRVLTALTRLTALNLHHTTWDEDAISAVPKLLAASLPHLRVLNVPSEALVRTTLCAKVLPMPGSAIVILNIPDQTRFLQAWCVHSPSQLVAVQAACADGILSWIWCCYAEKCDRYISRLPLRATGPTTAQVAAVAAAEHPRPKNDLVYVL